MLKHNKQPLNTTTSTEKLRSKQCSDWHWFSIFVRVLLADCSIVIVNETWDLSIKYGLLLELYISQALLNCVIAFVLSSHQLTVLFRLTHSWSMHTVRDLSPSSWWYKYKITRFNSWDVSYWILAKRLHRRKASSDNLEVHIDGYPSIV